MEAELEEAFRIPGSGSPKVDHGSLKADCKTAGLVADLCVAVCSRLCKWSDSPFENIVSTESSRKSALCFVAELCRLLFRLETMALSDNTGVSCDAMSLSWSSRCGTLGDRVWLEFLTRSFPFFVDLDNSVTSNFSKSWCLLSWPPVSEWISILGVFSVLFSICPFYEILSF